MTVATFFAEPSLPEPARPPVSEHRPLAKGSNPRYSLSDAARLWLDEKSDYDRPANACVNDRECLHYTQVVWCTSTRVGAARARCGNG